MTSFLEPWYWALNAKGGVIIRTNNIALAKAKLYAARASAKAAELADLSIVISPIAPESELWIVKRNDPAQQAEDEGSRTEPDSSFDVPV